VGGDENQVGQRSARVPAWMKVHNMVELSDDLGAQDPAKVFAVAAIRVAVDINIALMPTYKQDFNIHSSTHVVPVVWHLVDLIDPNQEHMDSGIEVFTFGPTGQACTLQILDPASLTFNI